MVLSLQQTVSELTTRVGDTDTQVEGLANATESINGQVNGLGNDVEHHSSQISEIESKVEVLEQDVGKLEESFDDLKNNTDGPSDGNNNSVQFSYRRRLNCFNRNCQFYIDCIIVILRKTYAKTSEIRFQLWKKGLILLNYN